MMSSNDHILLEENVIIENKHLPKKCRKRNIKDANISKFDDVRKDLSSSSSILFNDNCLFEKPPKRVKRSSKIQIISKFSSLSVFNNVFHNDLNIDNTIDNIANLNINDETLNNQTISANCEIDNNVLIIERTGELHTLSNNQSLTTSNDQFLTSLTNYKQPRKTKVKNVKSVKNIKPIVIESDNKETSHNEFRPTAMDRFNEENLLNSNKIKTKSKKSSKHSKINPNDCNIEKIKKLCSDNFVKNKSKQQTSLTSLKSSHNEDILLISTNNLDDKLIESCNHNECESIQSGKIIKKQVLHKYHAATIGSNITEMQQEKTREMHEKVPAMITLNTLENIPVRITSNIHESNNSTINSNICESVPATIITKVRKKLRATSTSNIRKKGRRAEITSNMPENVSTTITSNKWENLPATITSNIHEINPTGINSNICENVPTKNERENFPTTITSTIGENIPTTIASNICENFPDTIISNMLKKVPAKIVSNMHKNVFIRNIPSVINSEILEYVPGTVASNIHESIPAIITSDVCGNVPATITSKVSTTLISDISQNIPTTVKSNVSMTMKSNIRVKPHRQRSRRSNSSHEIIPLSSSAGAEQFRPITRPASCENLDITTIVLDGSDDDDDVVECVDLTASPVVVGGGRFCAKKTCEEDEVIQISEEKTYKEHELRYVIIDGSNVAFHHSGLAKMFSCKGIELVVQYFLARGHKDVLAVVPQARRRTSDRTTKDVYILERLALRGHVSFTPSRVIENRSISSYDDRYILKLASMEKAVVVSNDNFRDLYNQQPDWDEVIQHRVLPYMFHGDTFMPPDDPLGKNGPPLIDFLRHPSNSIVRQLEVRSIPTNNPSLRQPVAGISRMQQVADIRRDQPRWRPIASIVDMQCVAGVSNWQPFTGISRGQPVTGIPHSQPTAGNLLQQYIQPIAKILNGQQMPQPVAGISRWQQGQYNGAQDFGQPKSGDTGVQLCAKKYFYDQEYYGLRFDKIPNSTSQHENANLFGVDENSSSRNNNDYSKYVESDRVQLHPFTNS